MLQWLILIIIGILLAGFIVLYISFKSKVKIIVEKNEATEKENELLEKTNAELKIQSENLKQKTEELRQQALDVKWEYNELQARRDEVKNSLNDLEQQSTDAAKKFYNSALEIAQNSFDKAIENISEELDEKRESAQQVYLDTLQDCVNDFLQEIEEKEHQLSTLENLISIEQENVNAAVAAAKRRQEMENKKDFYRLVLSDEDIAEIKRLREVLPYLRDKTPLNKIIYKVYYEKPLTDLIGRVVGPGAHTGIYKITHIDSGKCYVGQAVSISDRWKQHCKRGVGAEDWTRNKLYPAMYSLGVENFSFEVIEECTRAQLNEREDYWQDFFHAKDFGYSIK